MGMTADIPNFDRDIELHGIAERDADALVEIIHKALREALCWPDAHPCGHFRDSPEGTTEIEGEYNLLFVAKAIRAAIP